MGRPSGITARTRNIHDHRRELLSRGGIVTTPRLVDRVGLGATGLPAITPRDVRSWLDRVRAGDLDPAETAATTRIVFRVWLVAFLFKALGSAGTWRGTSAGSGTTSRRRTT